MAARPLLWVVVGSVASCGLAIAATRATGRNISAELALGLAGPLASTLLTWMVRELTNATTPERLQAMMLRAFGLKMVFFAIYVIVAVNLLALRPVPFIASFTVYYVALLWAEALTLMRMAASTPRSA